MSSLMDQVNIVELVRRIFNPNLGKPDKKSKSVSMAAGPANSAYKRFNSKGGKMSVVNPIKKNAMKTLPKKDIDCRLNTNALNVLDNGNKALSANYLEKEGKFNFDIISGSSKSTKVNTNTEINTKWDDALHHITILFGKENLNSRDAVVAHKRLKENKNCENAEPQTSGTRSRKTIPLSCSKTLFEHEREKFLTKEHQQQHVLKNENPRTSHIVTAREEIFSCIKALKEQEIISPIKPNPKADKNSLIFGTLRKPKIEKRSDSKQSDIKQNNSKLTLDSNIFGDEEYLDDNLTTSKEQEKSIVLSNSFLYQFNPDSKNRKKIVNWLLHVQNILKIDESEFYLSVNLLDQVLAKLSVPKNMYQLVTVTCLWISNKFVGSQLFSIFLLKRICGTIYSDNQIVQMEEKILKLLNFKIHSVEPSLFINIYLKKLNFENETEIHSSVYFILDCAAHLNEFSAVPTSVVAAASVIIAFKVFHADQYQTVKSYFNQHLSKSEYFSCKIMQFNIIYQIENLKEENLYVIILNKYKDCPWLQKSLEMSILKRKLM